ncbi:MAG: gliding motility-associated C-terminal domain-containing protein [Bacteroidetes bacterium]|nr:gliding motility-associated C-terminal domain-containing protein [Bacteroidota bacterium]
MVINGNFDAGVSGFSTSYVPGSGGAFGLLTNAGTYAVTTNPRNVHNNFAIFADHTSGTGNMLVVNGDDISNVNIWCETFPVIPNTNYEFSTWVATCVASNPAVLQFLINGVQVGSNFTASLTTGIWTQFTHTWFSGANTTATICIVNQNIVVSGNDFALDDISLRQICTLTDSVAITIIPPASLQLGNDTVLCEGQQLTLDATVANGTSYLWNTGDTTATLPVNSTGFYSAHALIGGVCPASDTIHVRVDEYPQVSLGRDTFLCKDASLYLDAYSPVATTYHWKNGSNLSSQTVSSPGLYWVHVSNGNCTSGDSIWISQVVLPKFTLGNDTSICIPDSVVLKIPALPSYYHFSWYDGTSVDQKSISQEGTYWLQMEDSGCIARRSIVISNGDCGTVFIPNSFTPNGDGKNDHWHVYPFSVKSLNTKVFNRWGEIIFSSDDPLFSWEGYYKGRFIETGVYNYIISGTYVSGAAYEFRGSVNIIR